MKHRESIEKIFSFLYEPWMNEEDREFVKNELLKSMGVTMEQLGEDLETGIKNGFPADVQVELVRRFIQKKKQKKS